MDRSAKRARAYQLIVQEMVMEQAGRIDDSIKRLTLSLGLDSSALGGISAVSLQQLASSNNSTPVKTVDTLLNAVSSDRKNQGAWHLLSAILEGEGKIAQSLSCLNQALGPIPSPNSPPEAFHGCKSAESQPTVVSLTTLGNIFCFLGNLRAAFECFHRAASGGDWAGGHQGIAAIYQGVHQNLLASRHIALATGADPMPLAQKHQALGKICLQAGNLEASIAYYTAALTISPCLSEVSASLGAAYRDLGFVKEAIHHARNSLRLCRGRDLVHQAEALSILAHSLQHGCEWRDRDAIFAAMSQAATAQIQAGVIPSCQPFHTLVYPLPARVILEISKSYARKSSANLVGTLPRQLHYPRHQGRLTIGYVSSDFCNHPLAHLTQSVYGLHDRSRFKIVCFATTPDDGSVYRRKILSTVEHFVDISFMTAAQAAAHVQAYGVHVLFNLNGWTRGARTEIFAHRPAPVQASFMGFCGTLGADYIPYVISDAIASPLSLADDYTEKIVQMPHSYFVNDHAQSNRDALDEANTPPRSAYGLPEDKIVLCNFNQLYKIDPCVFDRWCQVLRMHPHCVLWLLRFPNEGEDHIYAEALDRGVPREQIFFSNVAGKSEHVRRGGCADLFLDTVSCNAHTTGCDILWSGTPLVAFPQRKMSSRVSASLLHALEMPELVSHSWDGYLDSICRLVASSSRDKCADGIWRTTGKLAELKVKVKAKRGSAPLFNTRHWVRNFEGAATAMWNQFEKGEPPSHIKIRDWESGEQAVDAEVHVEDHICPLSKLPPEKLPRFLDELGAPPPAAGEQRSGTIGDDAALQEEATRLISDIRYLMAPQPPIPMAANSTPPLPTFPGSQDCTWSLPQGAAGLGTGIPPLGLGGGYLNVAGLWA